MGNLFIWGSFIYNRLVYHEQIDQKKFLLLKRQNLPIMKHEYTKPVGRHEHGKCSGRSRFGNAGQNHAER